MSQAGLPCFIKGWLVWGNTSRGGGGKFVAVGDDAAADGMRLKGPSLLGARPIAS